MLTLAAAPRFAAANCGAEGCPLQPQGPEVQFGRYSFDFGYQYVEADQLWSGTHEITPQEALAAEGGAGHTLEQLTLTRTYLVNGRARITPRLLFTASVPYIDRVHEHTLEHHTGYFIPSTWHMQGLGDATVYANWIALSSASRGPGALSLQGGIKLPTGVTDVQEVNGEQPEPPARPGTGSTDFIAGLQYAHTFVAPTLGGRHTAVPLSLNVGGRYNGLGTEDYRVGNELTANLGASYGITRRVQVLGQLNAAAHARDDVGHTDAEPHSTGSIAYYAAPGLRAEVVPGMSLYGYYQFRLYQHTNGVQLTAPYHLSFGLSYALSR
jgi:hypothetical protein